MSGAEEGAEDKPHDPTERRLDEARRKGDIPRSADLPAAAALGCLAAGGVVLADVLLDGFGAAGAALIGVSHAIALDAGGAGRAALAGYAADVAAAAAALILPCAAAAMIAVRAQGPIVLAGSKLAPRLSRISPLAGLRNRFGASGLVMFGKSMVKFALTVAALALIVRAELPRIVAAAGLDARGAAQTMVTVALAFAGILAVLQAAIAAPDYLWQRFDHRRRLRMSHQELREDVKQSEGDPHLRAARRQRAVAIATNRMMADVPTADVVIVNPTHYAVALRWNRASGRAPFCVAKGTDGLALRIRAAAEAAGVPLRHDPPTARVLHAMLKVGDEIRPEHYRAVAAAIRYAEGARRRARQRGRP